MTPTTDDFSDLLAKKFEAEAAAGEDHLVVRSGDLHDELYPDAGTNHRMPACCNAMCAAWRNGDEVLESPRSGQGRKLVIRYRIPR